MSARVEEFVALITQHQPALYAFVLSLLGNRTDTDEVVQETNLVLWRKFDQFHAGSDFRLGPVRLRFMKYSGFCECAGAIRVISLRSSSKRPPALGWREVLKWIGDKRRWRPAWKSSRPAIGTWSRGATKRRPRPRALLTRLADRYRRCTRPYCEFRRTLFECIHRQLAAEERG
jgi:hypothetical protein